VLTDLLRRKWREHDRPASDHPGAPAAWTSGVADRSRRLAQPVRVRCVSKDTGRAGRERRVSTDGAVPPANRRREPGAVASGALGRLAWTWRPDTGTRAGSRSGTRSGVASATTSTRARRPELLDGECRDAEMPGLSGVLDARAGDRSPATQSLLMRLAIVLAVLDETEAPRRATDVHRDPR
jgi:hypothetical protein